MKEGDRVIDSAGTRGTIIKIERYQLPGMGQHVREDVYVDWDVHPRDLQ